jgi:hypothetical protein
VLWVIRVIGYEVIQVIGGVRVLELLGLFGLFLLSEL